MKRILLLALSLTSINVHAQNWNPLPQVGVKRYFTNEDGYLRGIRVDSIRLIGADSVFYPFRSLRGSVPSQTLDSNGSSWLGKAVHKRPDGTWLFNTWKSDTVMIKTSAAIGDTWRLYDDTGALWYRATITSAGTQTVLGVVYSIKTITLAAMSGASPLASDSLNGWTMILSKNHGLVAVPDLYMLPYPKDGTQNAQQDLFFGIITNDQAVLGAHWWGSYAGVRKARFSLTAYEHPTPAKLYATWLPGDALYYSWSLSTPTSTAIGLFVDTVMARTPSPAGDVLALNRWKWNTFIGSSAAQTYPSLTADSTTLVDTLRMPEEFKNLRTCYYNPADISYAKTSAIWRFHTGLISFTGSLFGGYIGKNVYKAGVGHVYFYNPCGQYPCDETKLLAYRIGSITYGTPFNAPLSILDASGAASTISVFPTPASTNLRVTHPVRTLTLHITGVTGKTIRTVTAQPASTTTDIDVADLPSGIYILSATAPDGSRHTQKLVITH